MSASSRLLKSTAFRLALTFAVVFTASFLVAGSVAYFALRAELWDRIDLQVAESFAALETTHATGGVDRIVAAINGLSREDEEPERVFRLVDATGAYLAGNLRVDVARSGWWNALSTEFGLSDDAPFRLFTAPVGDLTLTVGESAEPISELLEAALVSLAWASAAVLALAIAGGLFLASRARHRINRIAHTRAAVGQGRLDERIRARPDGDDLDQLGLQINAALDRVAQLVEGLKQMSSDIAHDLTTPLSRLFMTIETAHHKADAGLPVSADLEEARGEAQQISDTFDALLRVAQIEAGSRRARFQNLTLGPIFETVLDAYSVVAEEAGQTLRCDNDGEEFSVFGDRQLLIQMFANLIENAIRHCPPGTDIVMTAKKSEGYLEVAVADTGPGIPETERENVLRRLYRLEKSRTTPGSGLGLSLVKTVADLHRATLELADNGPGLRVTIRFPS